MAIKSSQFYKKLEQLENARLTGIENLRAKGLQVSDQASIPNISDKIKDIPSSSTTINYTLPGDKILYAADLPDNYLYLLKDNKIINKIKTPDSTGGVVPFNIEEVGEYQVARSKFDSDTTHLYSSNEYTVENITTTFGFEESDDGYISNTNYYGSARLDPAVAKISFTAEADNSTLLIYIESDGYYNSSIGGAFSELDSELSTNKTIGTTEPTKIKLSEIKPGYIKYENISAGEHFIYVKFTRDYGGLTTNKQLRFKIVHISNWLVSEIIDINSPGEYYSYHPSGLNDFSWEQIEFIANNHYGQYMFKYGDEKYFPFSGTPTCDYAYFVASENVDLVNGSKANMTFMVWTPNSLKFSNIAKNTSWVDSDIRASFLEVNDAQYIYAGELDETSSGAYFVWDSNINTFVQKNLPDDFNVNDKYFTVTSIETTGAKLTTILNILEPVRPKLANIKTWIGFGGSIASEVSVKNDNTYIITQDLIYLPSASNIKGDYRNLFWKLGEGEIFDLYRIYDSYATPARMSAYSSYAKWTRSPATSFETYNCTHSYTSSISTKTRSDSNSLNFCFSL